MSVSRVFVEEFLDRFLRWAESRHDVQGAIILGSWARTHRPADEWSDLDLVFVATDAQMYILSTDWLKEIGNPLITFVESIGVGPGKERRVIFQEGLDVNFIPVGKGVIRQLQNDPQIIEVVRRGFKVILDKDDELSKLPFASKKGGFHPPSDAEFLEVVNDFWYHAVWTAKKLRRGELWVAKWCCDTYMKRLILQAIELQARLTKGWEYETWFDGRFLERWADTKALEGLRGSFAHYDEADVRDALRSTMSLFRSLGRDIAIDLGYSYPVTSENSATELVNRILS